MPETYRYTDPDSVYTDPGTGVLRNLGDITDEAELRFFESAAVGKRLRELRHNSMSVKDARSLLAIHRLLFQDVYAWAGKPRTVEISKDGKPFFPTSHFNNAFRYVDVYQRYMTGTITANVKMLTALIAELLVLVPQATSDGSSARTGG